MACILSSVEEKNVQVQNMTTAHLHETPCSVISPILHEDDIILTVSLSMIRT